MEEDSGSPRIIPVDSETGTVLQIDYLNRKDAENVQYATEFTDHQGGKWETATSSPTIFPINETWERVRQMDHKDTSERRFGRVSLRYVSPPKPVIGQTLTPDGAFLSSLTPTIAWEGTGFEAEYDFELAGGITSNSLPFYSAILPMPWAQIAPEQPLDSGTTYHWRQQSREREAGPLGNLSQHLQEIQNS
jgi:hypothetical protein